MFDASTWNGDDPNGFFEMRYAYGYTHSMYMCTQRASKQ